MTCDFEDGGACGWHNVDSRNYWKVASGLVGTGPYAINGTISGDKFLYLDSNDLPILSQSADLETSVLPPISSVVHFYYRAHGFGIASLSLFVEIKGLRYLLWQTGDTSRYWLQNSVSLCIDERFKVLLAVIVFWFLCGEGQ